jgi:hypothetical protein
VYLIFLNLSINRFYIDQQSDSTLYVHLLPSAPSKWPPSSIIPASTRACQVTSWSSAITAIYNRGSIQCSKLDLRVLFQNANLSIQKPIHQVFFESGLDPIFRETYLKANHGTKGIELILENADVSSVARLRDCCVARFRD